MDDARIVNNQGNLINAEKAFHRATGVIPFTYFKSNGTIEDKEILDKEADALYKELFNDEDHFVVVFTGAGTDCTAGYSVGKKASLVMDDEATRIFDDYLKMYFGERKLDFEPFMVNAYKYTQERIMSTMNFSTTSLIFGLVIITFFVYTLYTLVRRR